MTVRLTKLYWPLLRAVLCAFAVVAVPAIESRPAAQSPAPLWLADDVTALDLGPWNCLRRPRVNGFDFAADGTPVVGWTQVEGCGGNASSGWSERLASGWRSRPFVPAPGIQMGGYEFGLGSDDRPYLYSIGFKDEVYRVYRNDLRAQDHGEPSLTDTGEVAGYNQQCVYTRFRLDRNGALTVPQRVMTIGDCGGRGPIRLNGVNLLNYVGAAAHDFALGPDGTAHVAFIDGANVYYARQGLGPVLVATVNRFSDDVGIAAGADGTLHLVARGLESTADYDRGKLGYYRSIDNGASWSLVETLNVNPAWGLNLELDSSGEPALAYWSYNELRFASRAGGAWTTTAVARPAWDGVEWLVQPRLRFDAAGVPHIAYYDWSANRVRVLSPAPAGVAPPVDLAVSGSTSPNPIVDGGRVTYTVKITNQSPRAASGMSVRVTLPPGAQLGASTPAPVSNQGGVLTYHDWTATGGLQQSLGPFTSATITFDVTGLAEGEPEVALAVTGSEEDPDTSNNDAVVRTRVNAGICALPMAGRTAWWPGDGTPLNYGSGSAYHGTPVGGVTYRPGAVGQAFQFDGATGYVNVPNGYDEYYWPRTSPMSVAAWFATGATSDDVQAIASMDDMNYTACCGQPQGHAAWYLYVQSGVLRASLRQNPYGSPAVSLIGARPVADGQFHHAALVIDIPALQAQLYLDGSLEASAPLASGWAMSNGDFQAEPLVIGAAVSTWADTYRYFFNGAIDDVALYKRALTAVEIAQAAGGPSRSECGAVPANIAPVAVDDDVATEYEEPIAIDATLLLANDLDADGDPLTVTSVGDAIGGVASLAGSTVSFTPAAGFSGGASFTYQISDGRGGTSSATVRIAVAPPLMPPTIELPAGQEYSGAYGMALTYDVIAATANAAATLQPIEYSPLPPGATLTLVSEHSGGASRTYRFVWTPAPVYRADGTAILTHTMCYRVSDTAGQTMLGNTCATITVPPPGRPPSVPVVSALTSFEGTFIQRVVMVQDPDGDPISFDVTGLPPGITASSYPAGTPALPLPHLDISGTSPAGSAGAYAGTLTVSDGTHAVVQAFVWTVRPPNRAPVAIDDVSTGLSDDTQAIAILANDSDPDGDALHLTAVSEPAHGTASIDGEVVRYRPRPDVPPDVRADEFTYTVEDSFGAASTAVVRVRWLAPGVDLGVSIEPAQLAVLRGQTFTTEIRVTNHGAAASEPVGLHIDGLPPDVTVVDGSWPSTDAARRQYVVEPLAPGESRVLSMRARVSDTAAEGESPLIAALVDVPDGDPDFNHVASSTIAVQPVFCFVPQRGLRGHLAAEGTLASTPQFGTRRGSVAFVPSRAGQAFAFDGTAGFDIVTDDERPAAFTASAWASRAASASGLAPVIGDGGTIWETWNDAVEAGYWLGFDAGHPVFILYSHGARVADLRAPAPVGADTWVHLAASYDGLTARLYVDGVEVAAQTALVERNGFIREELHIGQAAVEIADGFEDFRFFTGLVDDVALHDRALEPAEIARLVGGDAMSCRPSTQPTLEVTLSADPDPSPASTELTLSAVVSNTGDGYVTDVAVALNLDVMLSAVDGQPVRDLGPLLAGESRALVWRILAPSIDGHFPVTAQTTANGFGGSVSRLVNVAAPSCFDADGRFIDGCSINERPIIEPLSDRRSTVDDEVSFQVMASEPDGEPLIFSAVGLPEGIVIDPSSGVIAGRVLAAGSGVHAVSVTVSDGRLSASTSFTWTVPHRIEVAVGRGARLVVNGITCDAWTAPHVCRWDIDDQVPLDLSVQLDPALAGARAKWSDVLTTDSTRRSLATRLSVVVPFTVAVDHPDSFFAVEALGASIPVFAGKLDHFIDNAGEFIYEEFLVCDTLVIDPVCEGRAQAYSTVQLTGHSDDILEFTGFGGACSGAACALTLDDGGKAVTATYRGQPVMLHAQPGMAMTLRVEDLTSQTVTTCEAPEECAIPIRFGNQVRVTPEGSGFPHWRWSGLTSAPDAPAAFAMFMSPVTVGASWRSSVNVRLEGSSWTGGPAPVHAYSATSGEVVSLTCVAGDAVTCSGTAPVFQQIKMTVFSAEDFIGWQGCLAGDAVTWCTQTSDQPVMNFVGRYGVPSSPPSAVADELVIVTMAGAGQVDVLANDSDRDGGALTLVGIGGAQFGAVTFSGSTVTYQPRAGDYAGHDAFTYTVSDADGLTATATVTVRTPADRLVDIHLAAGAPVASPLTGFAEIPLTIQNLGPATATAVRLTLIGSGTRVASIAATRSGDSCRIEGADWVCDLQPLTLQANTSLRVRLAAAGVGESWRLDLVAFAVEVDAAPADNRATLDVNVPIAVADLAVTLDGPIESVLVNGDLVFTATIRNLGPDRSVQVPVTLQLPGVMTGAVPGGCTAGPGGTLTCSVPPLAAAQSMSFTATRRSATPGTLTGTLSIVPNAEASVLMRDPQPANDTASRQVVVVADEPIAIAVDERIGVRTAPGVRGGSPIVRIELSERVGVHSQVGSTGGQSIVRIEVAETVGVRASTGGPPPGPVETPAGGAVEVVLFPLFVADPIVMTYQAVTTPGVTTASPIAAAPLPPVGYVMADPPMAYELTTTAGFEGVVEVCVPYDRAAFRASAGQRLMHFDAGAWVDITTELDVDAATVCGTTSSLSPFAVMEADIPVAASGRLSGIGGLRANGWHHRFAFDFADGRAGRASSSFRYERSVKSRDGIADRRHRSRWQIESFAAVTFDSVTFIDDPSFTPGRPGSVPADAVVVRGTGRWDGRDGYRFELRAEDHGEPGRGRDWWSLTVRDGRGVVVVEFEGVLDAGNIQAHRPRRR